MKSLFVSIAIAGLLSVVLGLGVSSNVHAADAVPKASSASDDEALLKRIEDSGAFDQLLERAIQRLTQKQNEARKKAQADAIARRHERAGNARPVNATRDHVYGDAKAPINIIEYTDFECAFCKRFHGTPEEVVKRMGGKANFVWRQFPLEMHGPVAKRAAEASECAGRVGGNDGFWKYADQLMKRTRSGGKGLPETKGDPLVALAAELKLNPAAFGKCLESGEMRQRVAEDFTDGQSAGVQGTPGVVVRNSVTGKSLFIEGAVSADVLEMGVKEVMGAQ